MFQNIINFLTQNAFLIVIIGGGLFNVLVRLGQKAKEQRDRREAHKELAHQKQESLRTGKPIPTAQPKEPTLSAPAPNSKAERQQRIEALRQERMEQLRALREKRANTSTRPAAASPAKISQNRPSMPPVPVKTTRSQRLTQQRAQSPSQQSRQSQSQLRTRLGQAANQPNRAPQVAAASQQAISTRRRPAQPQQQVQQTPEPKERVAGQVESLRDASSLERTRSIDHVSARSLLRSKASVRQAFVLKEILDTPIALRDQDIASGSLFS